MSLPNMTELYNIGHSFFYNGYLPVISPLLLKTDVELPTPPTHTPNSLVYEVDKTYDNFKDKIEGKVFYNDEQQEYLDFKKEIERKGFRKNKEKVSIFDNMFDGKIEERIITNKYSKSKANDHKTFNLGNINGSTLMKRRSNMYI